MKEANLFWTSRCRGIQEMLLVTPGQQVKIKVKITLKRIVQFPLLRALDGDGIMTTRGLRQSVGLSMRWLGGICDHYTSGLPVITQVY